MRRASKPQRLKVVMARLAMTPAEHTSLGAYRLLERVMEEVEDEFLGPHTYDPPRSFRCGRREKSERMYATKLESVFDVPGYTGVQILISHAQVLFISRFGAIEVQSKDPCDKRGEVTAFEDRLHRVLFRKPDAWGDGAWHPKNH